MFCAESVFYNRNEITKTKSAHSFITSDYLVYPAINVKFSEWFICHVGKEVKCM